jgi:hypothetical protein
MIRFIVFWKDEVDTCNGSGRICAEYTNSNAVVVHQIFDDFRCINDETPASIVVKITKKNKKRLTEKFDF